MKFISIAFIVLALGLVGHEDLKFETAKAETTQETIARIFHEAGIPDAEIEMALRVVEKESEFYLDAMGDGGSAIGLWQIHDNWHEVSILCRESVTCSTLYAAKLWKEGHEARCNYWAVYEKMYCL